MGLSHADLDKVDALVKERIALKKGDSLYRHGNPMTSVYSILKQNMAFPMGALKLSDFIYLEKFWG